MAPPCGTPDGGDGLRRRGGGVSRAALEAENEKLQQRVAALEAQVAALGRESVLESTISRTSHKRWSTLNIFLAFMAGGLFVLADSKWGESQFTAGILYAIGAVVLVFTVPALHATGLVRHSAYKLWQPFRGGVRFVVLQALSWAFYGLAIVALGAAVMFGESAVGLLWGGGVLGIVSQILMASSLHVFVAPLLERDTHTSEAAPSGSPKAARRASVSHLLHRAAEHLEATPYQCLTDDVDGDDSDSADGDGADAEAQRAKAEKMDYFAELLTLNFLLIIIMVALAQLSEMAGHGLPAALSLVTSCIALFLTHGLGGKVLDLPGWRFFQPFAGGTQFVLIQAVTWALFSISLLCQLGFLYAVVYLGVKFTMGLMHIGGITAFIAQLLCMLSFRYYRENKKTLALRAQEAALAQADPSIVPLGPKREALAPLAVVIFIWNCQFVPYLAHFLFVVSPTLLPNDTRAQLAAATGGVMSNDGTFADAAYAAGFGLLMHTLWITNFSIVQTLGAPRLLAYMISPPWMVFATQWHLWGHPAAPMALAANLVWLLYSSTYLGEPDKGGQGGCSRLDRRWVVTTRLWDTIKGYFFGRLLLSAELQALVDAGKGLRDPAQQFMMGYHPHGIIPSGMVWLSRCTEWHEKLPGVGVTCMTASVMHYVPLMRDFLHWAGIREVSKRTVEKTIAEGLNPCIVVGGQSELFLSKSWTKELAVVTYHNGFFKIAQDKQLPLVPVFAFGETKIFDNVDMPATQRWFKDRLGFPIPFLLMGRWGLPFPRRKQVVITVGAPVHPEPGPPDHEAVEKLKKRYFAALEALFNEFKAPCGYADHSISFVNKR